MSDFAIDTDDTMFVAVHDEDTIAACSR